MKCHTGMDAGSGFVHTVEVTAANVHDVTVAVKLLCEDDEVVYGAAPLTGSVTLRTANPLYVARWSTPTVL